MKCPRSYLICHFINDLPLVVNSTAKHFADDIKLFHAVQTSEMVTRVAARFQ